MVKRIRTLLTLFLLVMGTTMSWAEFKDFEINLTEAAPDAGNASAIPSAFLPEGVTQISYPGDRTAAYDDDNGYQHGWQYAAFQFAVDGPVDIIIGGCQYSNVNATITDVNDNVLAELDTKSIGCGGSAWYRYKGKAATLKVYCGQYCPSIKVQNPTKDSFEASWDWTKEPDALYKTINSSVGWLLADNGISMYVDASKGKLSDNGGKAQCVNNTRLLVPVYGSDDEISVIGWGGIYTSYSIHGVNYTGNATVTVDADDVKQGYIVITGTSDNNYIKTITLKHTASAANPVAFEDFKIDFRSNPFTVVLPASSGLPACVTSIDAGTYHGNQHGAQFATITVKVDGPVKFTIGGCRYTKENATVSVTGGAPIELDQVNADCDGGGVGNGYSKNVVYRYNSETPATLTFNLGEYCPYFFAEKYEYIPDVKVTYYDTNGTKVIGTETVEGGSALKFKYGESDVAVSSGKKFRGWYDGNTTSAKPVEEGVALTANMKLYAKTTPIEVATTTSTHTYDLTKANWYQNEHDLIEINGGNYYNDGSHGWIVSAGSTVKLKVAGDALISISCCEYAHKKTMTLTDASNKVIGEANAKVAVDGEVVSFKYTGGATTLTLTFAGVAYIHNISVEHIVPVAFKPFKINFRTNPYTILAPEGGLPDNVSITGGKFNNEGSSNEENRHGYQNVMMTVKTDRPVKFTISKCFYADKATVSVDGGAPTVIETNAETCDSQTSYDKYVTYIYEGTGNAVLKFNLCGFCHYFFAEELSGVKYDETTNTYMVAAGNANQLKDAISEANATGNVAIYLPNGIYDLGKDINTAINGNNIAIIGESRDGVIIKNAPTEEGLDKSATLKNTSTGLYLQDLTIQCNAPYNAVAQAERGVALWDKGTKTICKNVYLKGKQDVYYSNGAEGMIAYFEGGKIEGAVDFLCGSGNVLFNSVTLNVVSGTNSGNIIAAPSTYASENGYVFANCLVTGNSNYYFARGWKAHEQASSAATFIATNMMSAPNSAYWGATMGEGMTRRFSAFDASGNVVKIDAAVKPEIITKASLVAFAGSWDPAAIISQHKPIKTNGAGWASYTAFTDVVINGADVKAYVARKINAKTVTLESIDGNKIPAGTPVFIYGADNSKYYVNGVVAGSVSGKNHLKPVLFDTTLKSGSKAFVIGTRDGVCGLYSVNSNILVPAGKCYLDATGYSLELAKDGLEIEILDAETTGIGNVGVEADDDATRYNLAGQKVGKDYKGIVVRKDGKKYLAK